MDQIGKYKILGILGKGGMGIVYKGLDPDIEREVAIKTIRFDTFLDGPAKEEMLNRVIREAKAAGRLNHPNIITIYDVIRETDLTFIVMQYVDGQTLQALIESGKTFSPQEVIDILKPVSEALDYAHDNGIVHRDIKPANILLDRAGKPFLADFGVARMEASTMTGPGTTIGTLSYMSPEQIMGKTADGRADFFALGVILFELLAGRKPFVGDNLSTIVYKIVHEEPERVTEINQNLPRGYEGVVRRALAKNPDERYQTGREMIGDLEDPDNLTAATRDYELKRGASSETPVRRKRPLALAGGLLVFAAVAGGIIFVLSHNAGESQSRTADRGTPKKQDVSPPHPPGSSPPPPQTAPAADSLAKLRESFELNDYKETVRLADNILSVDPGDAAAREFRIKAKAELDTALVAARLRTGIADCESGNYAACVRDMEEILRLDENNRVARDYLYKADTALSKRDILAMIERRRQAEENEDLEGLLRGLDSEALASQERSYYSMIFTIYDGIKSKIQDNTVSVSFSDRTHATASFHHAIQGISKKDGKQKPILFAQKQWTLEKRANAWKIVGIQERP
ncbi:MAG: serine/threonine-protein kinase [Candidatus Aminicenantes bacterium]|nr:serine/threonine-protein kinase [Candidatus Aminicenantes bacterium]